MITPKQQKAMDLYTILMFEAKNRLEAINLIVSGQTRLPSVIVRELGFLQLRMLCETVAVACLVAHGDLTQPMIRKFDQEYAADKILKMMEGLDQTNFIQQAEFPPGEIRANTKKNAITKPELFKLYAMCGAHLHRGRVKVITTTDQLNPKIGTDDILVWGQKFEDLLGSHVVPLFATQTKSAMLLCILRDKSSGFNPSVHRIEFDRGAPSPG